MVVCIALAAACPGADRSAQVQAPAAVVINEVLASNGHTVADPQGEYEDWIELYNGGSAPVNLGGMYLTDDPSEPTKWQFPKDNSVLTTIPAHGYLVVWADGEVGDAGLHAAFKLSAGGDSVALFDQDGRTLIDSVTFGPQRADVSYGRFPDGSDTWLLLTLPMPGAPNISIYQGFVEKPQVSPGRGFYDTDIQVSIICPTAGATIYYTTDGTPPYLAALVAALAAPAVAAASGDAIASLDAGVCVYLDYLWQQRESLAVVHPWFEAAYHQLCEGADGLAIS